MEAAERIFVGFYWTLPVPRTGMRALPPGDDIEAAARKSRTIRYQREVVRAYVSQDRGQLVGEFAFMDIAPDRGTSAIEESLSKIAVLCTKHRAKLLYVRFAESFFWRPHIYLTTYLEAQSIANVPLPAEVMYIDGRRFCPIEHFRSWQIRHQTEPRLLRIAAHDALAKLMDKLPDEPGRYRVVAGLLNEQGVKTSTGRLWTAEAVRKA